MTFTLRLVDSNSAVGMANFNFSCVYMYSSQLFNSFMSHYVQWTTEEGNQVDCVHHVLL